MQHIRTGTTARIHGARARSLASLAASVVLVLSLGAGAATADSRDHRNADTTFTKWITEYPAMAGVVGGDVGGGTYAGEIIDLTVTASGLEIDAAYHFSGSRHAFTAMVHVSQNGFTNGSTAVISGTVTNGWLRGNAVEGGYTQIACDAGTCFQGVLHILKGSKD